VLVRARVPPSRVKSVCKSRTDGPPARCVGSRRGRARIPCGRRRSPASRQGVGVRRPRRLFGRAGSAGCAARTRRRSLVEEQAHGPDVPGAHRAYRAYGVAQEKAIPPVSATAAPAARGASRRRVIGARDEERNTMLVRANGDRPSGASPRPARVEKQLATYADPIRLTYASRDERVTAALRGTVRTNRGPRRRSSASQHRVESRHTSRRLAALHYMRRSPNADRR